MQTRGSGAVAVRSRPAAGRARARAARGRDRARARAAAESKLREFFSRNFCMVAIARFRKTVRATIMPTQDSKPQSKIRPGSAGKNSRVQIFSTISVDPV